MLYHHTVPVAFWSLDGQAAGNCRREQGDDKQVTPLHGVEETIRESSHRCEVPEIARVKFAKLCRGRTQLFATVFHCISRINS